MQNRAVDERTILNSYKKDSFTTRSCLWRFSTKKAGRQAHPDDKVLNSADCFPKAADGSLPLQASLGLKTEFGRLLRLLPNGG